MLSYLPLKTTRRHDALIALSIFAALSACAVGQDTGPKPEQKANGNTQKAIVAKGERVSELSKSIWIIFQDKNNNHWFGSNGHGVYLYDGKGITQFTTKDGLPSNQVREIKEDKSGNVYVSTPEGVSKFDAHSFATLKPIPIDSPTDGWRLDPGDLWFYGKENGPYRYDGKSLYHLTFPKHYLDNEDRGKNPKGVFNPYSVYKIYQDRKGHIWFGTAGLGVCRYDGKTCSWIYEDHLTNPPGGGSFGIRSILEDKAGAFWICNTRYRFLVDPKDAPEPDKGRIKYKREKGIEQLKTEKGQDHIYFMAIVEDKKGALWMATYAGGVWRYDGESMTRYPVKDGSKEITLFSIYKDNRGDLWLGTHEAGAYKFNGTIFEQFRP